MNGTIAKDTFHEKPLSYDTEKRLLHDQCLLVSFTEHIAGPFTTLIKCDVNHHKANKIGPHFLQAPR